MILASFIKAQPAPNKAVTVPAASTPSIAGNGVDISRASGVPTDEVWRAMKQAGVKLVVVQAWGGETRSPVAEQQLLAAQRNGIRTAAFMIVNFESDESGDSQAREALEAVGTAVKDLKFLAIDVEPCCAPRHPYDPKLVGERVQRIREALKTVENVRKDLAPPRSRAAKGRKRKPARPHLKAIIYTTRDYWKEIAGDSYEFAEHGVPLWDSPAGHFESDDGLTHCGDGIAGLENFVPYPPPVGDHAGWQARAGKQYDLGPQITNKDGRIVCPGARLFGITGRNVDLDIFAGILLK